MRSADSVSVPSYAVQHASVGADVDLVATANASLAALGKQPISCARRIFVGTSASNAGVLKVAYQADPSTTITFNNVIQGSFLTGAFVKLISSGTTVTNLVVEY